MTKEKIIQVLLLFVVPMVIGMQIGGLLFLDHPEAKEEALDDGRWSVFRPANANAVLPEDESIERKSLMDTFGSSFKEQESYPEESPFLRTEAVLTPDRSVVISSSHAGQIQEIPFSNGERFKKGDVLVKYDCRELEAEKRIKGIEEQLAAVEKEGSERLYKLDLISEFERESAEVQQEKIQLQIKALEARLDNCTIRADFDGIVTDKLANAGEFTRTDRVLMEVVSLENLHAQILVPSVWLRWINVGAPVSIEVEETTKSYDAEIIRIHGEIDPVTKSVQIVAELKPHEDNLLSGMSGIATLDLQRIRQAGVKGYLVSNKEQEN